MGYLLALAVGLAFATVVIPLVGAHVSLGPILVALVIAGLYGYIVHLAMGGE